MIACSGLFAQQQPVVAVAPFDAISGISATDANMITRVFFIRLGNTNRVSLVDRNVVDRVLREHSFQAGDWSDAQKTAELGRALNSDWIVRGELEAFGDNILVTVQFYDIQTFRFMGGADILLANAAEAMEKMDPLVNRLVETIANSATTMTSRTAPSYTTSEIYKIGDRGPGGGIIFFARDGIYIECSGDISTGSQLWSLANQMANNYDGGGLTGWRLPTRNELDLMFANLRLRNLGSFDTSSSSDTSSVSGYWSSESGWMQNFSTGNQRSQPNDHIYRFRAVRQFSGARPSAPAVVGGTFRVGDRGPGGGTIFLSRDGTYMECSGELTGPQLWRIANLVANNYDGGGFTDWRLPTRDELNSMYVNLRLRGFGSFDTSNSSDTSSVSGYWSSESGWMQNFSTGNQRSQPNDHIYRFRAVRQFR
jgi:TolB-like protein